MHKDARIYVAGHRGLVGSAIVKQLQAQGYHNLILRTHAELDLTRQHEVEVFFEDERPEYVFLAAAFVGGIMANNTYRADFIYRNLAIQTHVIHEAYRSGVKKLCFLGSTCIYPREATQPICEDALLTAPLEYTNEPYAIAKIAGLKMCESYNLQYGTNFIAVMPTNLYGPGDNFDLATSHVLPALMRKMHIGNCLHRQDWDALAYDLDRRPIGGITGQHSREEQLNALTQHGIHWIDGGARINLWGSGQPLREFLWSEDMAAACIFVMQQVDFKDTYASGQKEVRNCHINIGTGEEISIADLASHITNTIGYEGLLHWDSTKPDGTLRKLTNPGKLQGLGWKHTVSLEQGIEQLYQWYLDN